MYATQIEARQYRHWQRRYFRPSPPLLPSGKVEPTITRTGDKLAPGMIVTVRVWTGKSEYTKSVDRPFHIVSKPIFDPQKRMYVYQVFSHLTGGNRLPFDERREYPVILPTEPQPEPEPMQDILDMVLYIPNPAPTRPVSNPLPI